MSESTVDGSASYELKLFDKFIEQGIDAFPDQEIHVLIQFVCNCVGVDKFSLMLSNPLNFSKLVRVFLDILKKSENVCAEKKNKKDSSGASWAIIQKSLLHTFVGIAGEYRLSSSLLAHTEFVNALHKYWFEGFGSEYSKDAVGILANLIWNPTNGDALLSKRPEYLRLAVFNATSEANLENENGVYEMYARVVINLSQSKLGGNILIADAENLLPRLFSLLDEKFTPLSRQAVVGTLKNCCLHPGAHDILLNPEVDILSALMPPLAGAEAFTDEEYVKMPITVQYLPDSKQRDPDPEVRKTILEALMKLCQTRRNREIIRGQNIYYILREYFEWETVEEIKCYIEDVINILIRTEEEIGRDDIGQVEVPSENSESGVQVDELAKLSEMSIDEKPTESTG